MQGFLAVAGFLAVLWMAGTAWAWMRRAMAIRLPPDEQPLRLARRIPARIFVSHTQPGGLSPRRTNFTKAHMALTTRRFILSSWHGLVLSIKPGDHAKASCTGPKRLVVEAATTKKANPTRVRIELVVDGAEDWASDIRSLLGAVGKEAAGNSRPGPRRGAPGA